jgi:hypothetical protein
MNSLYPKKILFGLHEKSCNLSCPKCLVHSDNYPRGIKLRKTLGRMKIEDIIRVFEEIKGQDIMVSPSFWSEPLLNKKLFISFVLEAKNRLLKFKGMDKKMFNLHLKEREFRFSHRDEVTYEILLKLFRAETLK